MFRKIFLSAFAMLSANFSFAQTSFDKAKLDSFFATLEQHNKAMGVLMLTQNGKTVYERAFGNSLIEEKNSKKNFSETKFRIGSITKTFTATMIMQLVEEGKISLTTTLDKFFPQAPNAQKITIENLLTHHSGLHNFTDDEDFSKWMTKEISQDDILKLISSQKPDFEPGEKSSYSNTNFVLLGYIIEKISGKNYSDNLRERISDKSGLKNTSFGGKISSAKNEAMPYIFLGTWENGPETNMNIPHGAGAIVSTAGDLAKFSEALFNGRLVSKNSLDEMMKLRREYGLGMIRAPFGKHWGYGHSGGIDGFHSMLLYFPDDNLTLSLVLNGLNYEKNDILIKALSAFYSVPYEIPDFSKRTKISADELAKYEGIFSSKNFPLKITVRRDGEMLTAQATGQGAFPLESVSEKEFRFDGAGIVMEFEKNPEGKISQFTLKQGAGKYLFTRE